MKWNLIKAFSESFRFKIILLSIVLMLITCFALTAFFVSQHRASLNDALVERGRLLVRVLANNAKVGIFSENEELLKEPAGNIARQPEVTAVSVYNEKGHLLFASSSREIPDSGADVQNASIEDDLFGFESDYKTLKIGEDLFGQLSSSNSTLHFTGTDAIQVWSAVYSTAAYKNADSLFFKDSDIQEAPKTIGFIRVALTKDYLKKQVYGFLSKALLISTSATAFGALLTFLLIRGITSPLNRLAEGIKTLGTDGVVEPILVDTKDEIGRLAAAFNEISESLKQRKAENFQLEMQLRQAQKLEALGTFAGGIAHDFNNVLTPIIGYTEILLEDVSRKDEIRRSLEEIYKASGRARDLVKQILAFSRQHKMQKSPLRIHIIVKEALKLLRASLPTTIAINQRIDPECGLVLADPTDIHRIVMNLGANAYHAMKDSGGQLEVSLAEDCLLEDDPRKLAVDLKPGKYAKLAVKDTGIGMDEETLQRIFDPYFTTKPSGEGTGMGLAVVHGIVKLCGGSILVKSKPGQGSIFEIYFPVMQSVTASVDTAFAKSMPRGSEHVLLVDDEAQIVYMWKQMLEQLGYRTTVRTSSLEALEAFAAQPAKFDAIVTDLTMPNMTGDELAIQAMRLREDIPVVLCTGFSEKIDKEKAKKIGIRTFLLKPVLRHQMATAVREALKYSVKEKNIIVGN